jgi:uncharacterized protein (TIGR00369 family)
MAKQVTDIEELYAMVRDVYERIPFNQLLGLKVHLGADRAGYDFAMKDELIGNFTYGILHGGVISSVLDATGGLAATASALERMLSLPADEIRKRISRVGTIDLRVDYLRPGKGTHFHSMGTIMRTGNKVAVTRMELRNQENLLIAVGTAAYVIS